jgi:hypothetical protein
MYDIDTFFLSLLKILRLARAWHCREVAVSGVSKGKLPLTA